MKVKRVSLSLVRQSTALAYLVLVFFLKANQLGQGCLLVRGPHDFMQLGFGAWLEALRQLVQDVGDLVHPTALFFCFRVNLAQRRPETQGAIGHGQLGCR